MKFPLLAISLSFLCTISPSASFAAEGGAPFAAIGEQIDHPVPKGWKLAAMNGKADGRFVVEYIPETEEIDSWHDGYLAIERLPYPTAEVMNEIERKKQTISEFALSLYIRMAKESCGGKHESMSQRSNTFNGTYFSVGGGFCDKYGPSAPFGEGSFVAFAQGKDFLFRIQYGWRPKSAQELTVNLPWHIAPEVAKEYLEAIKASSLCAGIGQPECKISEVIDKK